MSENTEIQTNQGNGQDGDSEAATLIYSKEEKEFIQIPADPDALMDEKPAAAFNDLTQRGMQNLRLTGKGPAFIRISSRCIKYRKRDMIAWQESKLRMSTSDRMEE